MAELSMDLESNLALEPKASKRRADLLPGRTRIILDEDETIPPVGLFIGVNGTSYMLKPGMEADVPQGVIDVLDNAIMSTPIIDQVTRQTVGYRQKRRYSYTRVR